MNARRGWIGEPQPPREWHDYIYSGQAERIAKYGHMKYTQRTTNPDHIGATSADDGRTDTLQIAERHRHRTRPATPSHLDSA